MPLSLISKSAGCTNGSSHDGCWYLPSTNPRHCPMIHRIHTFGPPPGPPPDPRLSRSGLDEADPRGCRDSAASQTARHQPQPPLPPVVSDPVEWWKGPQGWVLAELVPVRGLAFVHASSRILVRTYMPCTRRAGTL